MRKPVSASANLGHRVRVRRKSIGLTQADLASSLGISFQQVQKYEKGINAISSERLRQICDILKLPQDFFDADGEALIGKSAVAANLTGAYVLESEKFNEFVASSEGKRLIETYMAIQDRKLRARLLDFVASLASDA